MVMDVKDWSSVGFDEGRQILRKWREDSVRRSEDSVEIWEHVLSRKPGALGDELWIVYEQIFVAALDCARLDVCQECITALNNKFPKSQRVLKLEAMRLEAVGKFQDALQYYDNLISHDEANAIFRKRKVAIYKAQEMYAEAIRELNDYLKKFMNDSEAWLELSNLFLEIEDLARAAFCIEELILSNPHNYLYHQRFAEIKYTQGGLDNIETAKAYFIQSAKLNPDNIRALYGSFQCCSYLLHVGKLTGQKRKDVLKLGEWASEKLLSKYEAEASSNPEMEVQYKALETVIKSAHLNTTASPAT